MEWTSLLHHIPSGTKDNQTRIYQFTGPVVGQTEDALNKEDKDDIAGGCYVSPVRYAQVKAHT